MSVFYQHIGRELWARDAPRTLGDAAGPKRFSMEEIGPQLSDIDQVTVSVLEQLITDVAPTGFQIWGLPSGAARVLNSMVAGDSLLLLESEYFRYAGQVLKKMDQPSWQLSRYLWGEEKFPIIVFLQGQTIDYPWSDFRTEFGFDPRYHMRGNTMRLSEERLIDSRYQTESRFLAHIFQNDNVRGEQIESEFELFAERVDAQLTFAKSRSGQASFRDQVLRKQGSRCAACSFDIPAGLEAAHLVPFSQNGSDDPRNGIALCVLHHRLYDQGYFRIDPNSLKFEATAPWSLEDLRISKSNILQLRNVVHEAALRWKAEN